jgi:energy-converting hydrogenase Eha subunit G
MVRWFWRGGRLVMQELPIENPNEIMERAGVLHILQEKEHRMKDGEYTPVYDEQGNEIFPLNVTFLAMIFLYNELIVTGGDDGYVKHFFIFFYMKITFN